VVEPAACATRTAMANIATDRKMFLFMETSGKTLGLIRLYDAPAAQIPQERSSRLFRVITDD
jgi:hypothetical protein